MDWSTWGIGAFAGAVLMWAWCNRRLPKVVEIPIRVPPEPARRYRVMLGPGVMESLDDNAGKVVVARYPCGVILVHPLGATGREHCPFCGAEGTVATEDFGVLIRELSTGATE